MHTIQFAPTTGCTRRLAFDASGNRLAAWIGREGRGQYGWYAGTESVWGYDRKSGRSSDFTKEILLVHGTEVGCDPALSPEFRYLVTEIVDVLARTHVLVEDLERPKEFRDSLPVGAPAFGGLAFTPDGRMLLVLHWQVTGVSLWSLEFGAFLASPREYEPASRSFTNRPGLALRTAIPWRRGPSIPSTEATSALAVSADSRFVALGTRSGTTHVLDLLGNLICTLCPSVRSAGTAQVTSRIGFAPCGRWIVRIGGGVLCADPLPEQDGPPWQWAAPVGLVHDFAFAPDGQTLAVADDRGCVHLLDPTTGAVRHVFDWHCGPLYSVAFAPDGMVAAAGTTEGRAILWDVDR